MEPSPPNPMTTCPIPSVTPALEPYILPRPLVLSIRQSLHSHLERQLRLENAATLSPANAADPPLTQTLAAEPPASLTGVRGAYWRALRAHQVARERFEGLRAELDGVVGNLDEGSGKREGDGGSVGEGLLPLVRAREASRRLGVVERAVEGVEAQGTGVVGAKVDEVVKRAVGEVPVLPSQRVVSGVGGGREEGERRMVELKKAVLSAQALIAKCAEDGAGVGVRGGGGSELHALQQARNELIGWIEKQLALIGDGQASAQEDEETLLSPRKTDTEERPNPPLTNDEITNLYTTYLTARSNLLTTLHQPPSSITTLSNPPSSPPQSRSSTSTDPQTAASASAALLLPYITPLLSSASHEKTLLNLTAYQRRHLNASETSSEHLMRRLADESHLVHPGASRGRDWTAAAEEAGEGTREFVLERARVGEGWEGEAEGWLRKVVGVVGELEGVVGRV